jgi:hypothetical protein
MIAETMTTLPVGESMGKNCLMKSMVAVTLVWRVLLASSKEGMDLPKSTPTAALATTQSSWMLRLLSNSTLRVIDSGLLKSI